MTTTTAIDSQVADHVIRREHIAFVNYRPVFNVVQAANLNKLLHLQIQVHLNCIKNADHTVMLYKFDETPMEAITAKDALVDFSQLPSASGKATEKFFQGFRARNKTMDTDPQYLQMKLGVNGDPPGLIKDIDSTLKQCKDINTEHSCDGRMFYKSLQFPLASTGGVLCGTFHNFDTHTWTTVLQEGMNLLVSGQRDVVPTNNKRIILATNIQKFK